MTRVDYAFATEREPTCTVLFRGASIAITDIQGGTAASCGPRAIQTHDLPRAAWQVTLLFVRAGTLHIPGGAQLRGSLADPARIAILARRDALWVASPPAGTYAATAIAISLPAADMRAAALASDVLTASPELLVRLQRLRHAVLRVPDHGIDSVVEREALAILDLALAARTVERAGRPRGARAVRHRALVERACALMAATPGMSHRLADVARTLAVSPFHLARTFRAHVGISIHQYLLRVRLARALEEIAGGERSLSVLALRLGFASHSHFTATFRRTFGLSPARFREAMSGAALHTSNAAAPEETRRSA